MISAKTHDDNFQSNLYLDGWKAVSFLPSGWLVQNHRKAGHFFILSIAKIQIYASLEPSEHGLAIFILAPYMQKAGDCGDISPQIFLDFPQNFRLRTQNQYCTQAIA